MPIIRPAQPADTHAIWQIFVSATGHAGPDYYSPEVIDAWSAEATQEGFERGIKSPAAITLVAEAEGVIVGFGKLDIQRREIDALYVSPLYQGGGAGRLLMDEMLRLCMEQGMTQVHLNSSLPAVGFYERAGFTAIEQTSYRLSTGVEMAIIRMRKALENRAPDKVQQRGDCKK